MGRKLISGVCAVLAMNVAAAAIVLRPDIVVLLSRSNAAAHRAQAAGPRVIHISVDGLGSRWFEPLLANNELPAFQRLMREGAWTLNARNDHDWTITLPNHTSMLTGRSVYDKVGVAQSGHRWTNNGGFAITATLHNNAGYYIASAFDRAHDAGLGTALYASKDKFSLYRDSYDAAGGAPDTTGEDDGRNKIDVYVNYDLNSAAMMTDFVANMGAAATHYTFVHFADADTAGHAYGWGSPRYNAALRKVDAHLAEILTLIDATQGLTRNTWIVLSADHGGTGQNHGVATDALNYTIPLIVWGPNAPADADLYALNGDKVVDPGARREDYAESDLQPIRNADTGNCALRVLGLEPISGSRMNRLKQPCGDDSASALLTALRSSSPWRYSDTGIEPAPGWRTAPVTTTWGEGRSPLGYGDPLSTTLTTPPACARDAASYLRTTMRVPAASIVTSATLSLRRDDGVVVYVNGVEALRDNMPSGPITHTTAALTVIDTVGESVWLTTSLSSTLFRAGDNAIAASLHQADPCSSDVMFDARLTFHIAAAHVATATPTESATATQTSVVTATPQPAAAQPTETVVRQTPEPSMTATRSLSNGFQVWLPRVERP